MGKGLRTMFLNRQRSILLRCSFMLLASCAATEEPRVNENPRGDGKPQLESPSEPRVVLVAIYHPDENWPADGELGRHPLFPAHAEYMHLLHAEGWIVRGGPFLDRTGALLEFATSDPEEVKGFVEEDPFVHGKVVSFSVHPWALVLEARATSDPGAKE